MIKIVLKFGLIGSLILFTYTGILSWSGIIFSGQLGAYLGYLAIIVMPFCTFLAIKEVRNKVFDRKITFYQAMLTGLLVSLIAACVFGGLNWVENNLFESSYQVQLIQQTIQSMEESGNSVKEIEDRIAAIEEHYGSWKAFRNTLIWYMSLGVLYSLCSYLILKYFIKT